MDQPLPVQYLYFLKHLFQGELGRSIIYKVDTLTLLLSRFEPTLMFICGSVILSVLIAVPLAAIAARRHNRSTDTLYPVIFDCGSRVTLILARYHADHHPECHLASVSGFRLRL
ncbi:hypothetical protein P4S72_28805 [Vibrio sp. PP-XX7]